MFENLPTNHVVATNYELFCDVEVVMGLACMLPMLEVVRAWASLFKTNIVSFVILW
jgi:hypothetical protein